MYEAIADEAAKAPPDYYRLLGLLDPDDRALLYLRLDRLSIRDIALATETTEAAVKQKLYRIRQKIDALKQEENAE
jgi:DNA-directed RNA polymerase specialized sigma24 family protein